MAVTISLPQPAYWPAQLRPSVQLDYAIDPPLPTSDNVLAFFPPGGSASAEHEIPFEPTSGTGSAPIPGDDPRVPWSATPPPGDQYLWTIQLQSAEGSVYAQATLQIVPPPSLLSIVYDGAGISAHFVPVAIGDPSYYALAVETAGGTLEGRTKDANENVIVLPLDSPLEGEATFRLETVGADSLVSVSAPASLLLDRPTLVGSVYDGAAVTARWLPVPGASTYVLRAFSSVVGKPAYENSVQVPQGGLDAPGLDETYALIVLAAAKPPVYSAASPLPFLFPLPQLLTGAYDGALVTAGWTPIEAAASYTMRAYAAGGPQYQKAVTNPDGELPAADLDPALSYDFTVQADAAGHVSAATRPAPMLLTFPTILGAVYDGSTVTARWLPVGQAERYTLRVFTGGGGPAYEHDAPIAQGSVEAPDLSRTEPYFFTITAAASGSVSSTIPPAQVLTRIPALLQGEYDLAAVDARWTPVDSPLVSGYTLRAYAAGAPEYSARIDSPDAGQGTLPIPEPLNPELAYRFELIAAVDGGVASAAGRRMLLVAPEIHGLDYAPADERLIASWSASPEPGVTGYGVELDRNGESVRVEQTTGLTYPFDQTLEDGVVFRARVRASDGVMSGPFSERATAPVALAVSADYDGFARLRQLQWRLAGQLQTYAYVIDDPGNITSASYASSPTEPED